MLTKLEKEIYKEIKNKFCTGTSLCIRNDNYLKCKDVFDLLIEREIVKKISVSNTHMFFKIGSFEVFEEWMSNLEKEERKMSRREWKIAIISGGIGSLISFIPDIINLISSLLK